MRNHRLLFLAGCLLTIPASGNSADGATLDGLWRSSSGAVYRYAQRGETVVATYEVLIEGQVAAGIKKGDLSLKGTYVDNVLSATFYQRAPLHIQAMCPEHQIIDLPVAWELNENVLGGTLVLVFGSDDHCQITRRQLQTFRLEREPAQNVQVAEPAGQIEAAQWSSPW